MPRFATRTGGCGANGVRALRGAPRGRPVGPLLPCVVRDQLHGYLLAALHHIVAALPRKSATQPAVPVLAKQVLDAVDALKDAASAVRTLAQAAVRDIDEDLARSREDQQRFVMETLLAQVTLPGGFLEVRPRSVRALASPESAERRRAPAGS